ncbi:hypothetical protein [Nocardia sp. NBC_01009]|uniref:hypothetical protein n=1 Tax=Nocardia sp. NBC_01009 TaxID=2975996 RepID=UPI00386B0260|nr:hypothetical protein OHA42_01800 [Nocardia sp. NBC_01009]
MKRTSAIALAAGAVVLLLAGCGGSDESAEANGLRKGTTGTSSSVPQPTGNPPTTGTGNPPTTGGGAATTPAKTVDPSLGPASRTTCGEFKGLDSVAEKALIEQILAENPNSSFAGSPNVALGTAKLVCLAPSNADTPVATAAGIVR